MTTSAEIENLRDELAECVDALATAIRLKIEFEAVLFGPSRGQSLIPSPGEVGAYFWPPNIDPFLCMNRINMLLPATPMAA